MGEEGLRPTGYKGGFCTLVGIELVGEKDASFPLSEKGNEWGKGAIKWGEKPICVCVCVEFPPYVEGAVCFSLFLQGGNKISPCVFSVSHPSNKVFF